MKVVLLASACAAALVSTSMTAQAQTASPDAKDKPAAQSDATLLNEVVVTATRRNERLQDVPLSVTAFSQKDLTAKGIVGYEGLARETPGVVLNKPTANFNNFTARGIATNGYGANLQSTVAIYIDELPISTIGNTTVLDPNLFDVERVEFLRGPQGTLFGSGSLSGALRILTKSPDLDEVDASALVDFGLTGSDSLRQRYNGMVNLPIVKDQLALRVVGFYRHEEGYVDNLGTGVHNSNTLVDGAARDPAVEADRPPVGQAAGSYEKSNPKDSSLIIPSLGRNKRSPTGPTSSWASCAATTPRSTINSTARTSPARRPIRSSTRSSGSTWPAPSAPAGSPSGWTPTATRRPSSRRRAWRRIPAASSTGWSAASISIAAWTWTTSTAPRRQYLAAHGITGLPDEYYQRQYTHINSHELAGFGELTYHFNDKVWLTGGMRYGGSTPRASPRAATTAPI
jgi:iron complex outermembrane receptor protein